MTTHTSEELIAALQTLTDAGPCFYPTTSSEYNSWLRALVGEAAAALTEAHAENSRAIQKILDLEFDLTATEAERDHLREQCEDWQRDFRLSEHLRATLAADNGQLRVVLKRCHELLADAAALINPEEHSELTDSIIRELSPCDAAMGRPCPALPIDAALSDGEV